MSEERILITAFEPFGIKGWLSGSNTSQELLEHIQLTHGDRVDYLVLPVTADCEISILQALFERHLRGVIAMGELLHLPWWGGIRVEPAAIPALCSGWPRFGRGTVTPSPFAQSLATEPTDSEDTGIGLYYCNRVYLQALSWGQQFSKPAVFLHIPVFGNQARYCDQVLDKATTVIGR